MFAGGKKIAVLSALVATVAIAGVSQAAARAGRHHATYSRNAFYNHTAHAHAAYARAEYARAAYPAVRYAHVIQCVAFAKADAGIEISGNARDWWSNAAGIYERGSRPENGSVLSFRANGRMPLGHVAVVSGVSDSRTIVIDQSHWNSNGIARDIEVKDVSEDNDWSAVRVQLGHGGAFGSIYPTHGFIYPRPDRGVMQANITHAPMPMLDPAPADLRRSRRAVAALEVAEAPERASGRPLDLRIGGLSFDAPSRGLQ